ncbi:MAG: ABC transporter ATP-binding protein [Flavobacteriales bacterium]|nr:ABC transporter ATP-binding protein [Flavobacteriales bacterium]
MPTPPLLQLRDLAFAYGKVAVLHEVELDLDEGNVLVVVGPSGCGKSTLLRLIAGLERPAGGSVSLGGETLSKGSHFIPAEVRSIGMVFQGLALFPHLTVTENVAFGLHHLHRSERQRRVQEELKSVGLDELGARYPHQLSGGQQQRVALARALVRRPRLLLLDEPFSDLDPRTRRLVREELARILREHRMSAIIVTHDREDAFHLGDRIAEMDGGRIVRQDTAERFREEWRAHPFDA